MTIQFAEAIKAIHEDKTEREEIKQDKTRQDKNLPAPKDFDDLQNIAKGLVEQNKPFTALDLLEKYLKKDSNSILLKSRLNNLIKDTLEQATTLLNTEEKIKRLDQNDPENLATFTRLETKKITPSIQLAKFTITHNQIKESLLDTIKEIKYRHVDGEILPEKAEPEAAMKQNGPSGEPVKSNNISRY